MAAFVFLISALPENGNDRRRFLLRLATSKGHGGRQKFRADIKSYCSFRGARSKCGTKRSFVRD